MIKGIIFDLDGTTVETLRDLHDSVNETMRFFGYAEKSFEEVRLGVGRGSRNLIKSIIPEENDERIEEVLNKYFEIYAKNCLNKSKPYDGMKELLLSLKEKDIKLAINSNKWNELTNKIIKALYPEIDFVEILGAKADLPHKPDPTGALYIIDKMNLNKKEVLYVGDSEPDMQTARNAGIKSVGCLWGFRDKKTLEEAGADYIIGKPEELLNYIGE